MNVNMEEGWTEVSHRKKEDILKQREDDGGNTYVLSQLIHNDACIHCMVGKCRERSKDHSPVYFPDQMMGYIRNPLTIKTLDETLKRNPIELEILKSYQVRYSVCMFNHCRKGCKNCHANRFSSMNIGDNILYICYPPLDRITRNTITVGLHIDMQMNQIGNRYDVVWRTKHNEILEENETESVSSPISSNVSPIVKNENKWASIVRKNLSVEELESFAVNDVESSKYMMDTEYVQRRVMNSPTERNESSPMQHHDRRRPPPRRNNEFEEECMYRFDVLLKEIHNVKDQNLELYERILSLNDKVSSLQQEISTLKTEDATSSTDATSSPKKYITW
jgi:hypothetical protein